MPGEDNRTIPALTSVSLGKVELNNKREALRRVWQFVPAPSRELRVMALFLVPDFITTAPNGRFNETMDPEEPFPGHAGRSRRTRAAPELHQSEVCGGAHLIFTNSAKLPSVQGFTCTNCVGRTRREPHHALSTTVTAVSGRGH